MSRDLTTEEKQKFSKYYGTGVACEQCGNTDVVIKIWEKYGSTAGEVGGDISAQGIVGAVVACNQWGHGETLARSQILKSA